jgi:hypothetical protein
MFSAAEHQMKPFHAYTLVSLLVLSLFISACGLLNNGASCNGDNTAASMKLALPPSARDVSEQCSSGLNPTYEATFTIAPADLVAFQQRTRITQWDTQAASAQAFQSQAAAARSLLTGHFGDGAYLVDALIDTSDPQAYRVYYRSVFVD